MLEFLKDSFLSTLEVISRKPLSCFDYKLYLSWLEGQYEPCRGVERERKEKKLRKSKNWKTDDHFEIDNMSRAPHPPTAVKSRETHHLWVLSQKFLRRISTFLTRYNLNRLSVLDLVNFAS